jgi:hypothetical protein
MQLLTPLPVEVDGDTWTYMQSNVMLPNEACEFMFQLSANINF